MTHPTPFGRDLSFSAATPLSPSRSSSSLANNIRLARLGAWFVACCTAVLLGIFIAQPTQHAYAANFCTNDSSSNDISPDGRHDLTQMCVDTVGMPNTLLVRWNWDDTTFGSNSTSGCAFIDTDGDGNANFAMCNTISNNTPSVTLKQLYSCNDSAATTCPGNNTVTSTSITNTIAVVNGANPFNSSSDTVVTNDIPLSTMSNPSAATVINVCSFSNIPPTSTAQDCIADTSPARLEIKKVLQPSTDAGKFNLQIGGQTIGSGANVGDGGSTGELVVTSGDTFSFGETAGTSTNLSDYSSSYSCRSGNGSGTTLTSGNGTSGSVTPSNNSDVVCTLTNVRKLAISKTAQPATFIAGQAVTYTIIITNNTGSTINSILVTDTLPSGLTFGSSSATTGSYNSGTGVWSTISLNGNSSATLNLFATVNSSVVSGTVIANTASTSSPSAPTALSASASNTVQTRADLQIFKTDSLSTVTAGDSVNYTIVVTNAGPSNVASATVQDSLPADLTGATWACTATGGATCTATGNGNINDSVSLPKNGKLVYTLSAVVADNPASTITNTASVNSSVTDPSTGNNTSQDIDNALRKADLQISKDDFSATYTPGDPIVYTIIVSNTGPSNVTAATVADTFPSAITGATWTCAASGGASCNASGAGNINQSVNLPKNSKVTFTVNATVAANATGNLINTATVTAPNGTTDNAPGNNTDTDTDTPVAKADLQISKSDFSATYTPGEPIAYTVIVTNAGPSDVSGATVADTLPGTISGATWTCTATGGATCTASGSGDINDTVDLPAGSSLTYNVNGTVAANATGNLVNTATVAAPNGSTDDTLGNNTATDTDTPAAKADLSVTKSDGSNTYTPGTAIAYTLVVNNDGPSDVSGATVADTLPSEITGATWTCTATGGATCTANGSGDINDTVDLPVGSSLTYSVNGTVAANATGNLVNTATVTAPSGTTDDTLNNNSATDTDAPAPEADLQISKDDFSATYTPGNPIAYTVIVTNAGPSDVSGATVADTLPGTISGATWTCTATGGATCTASGSGDINDTVDLPAGSSLTYNVNGTVAANATGNLVNTATVTAPDGTTDNTPSNNTATDTDAAAVQADLSINKLDNPDPVTAGRRLTYTLVVFNAGPSLASGIAITDALPAQTTLVSADDPNWACTIGDPLTCTYTPTLAVNTSASLRVVVDVSAAATGSLRNTAAVSADSNDTNPTNNYAEAATTVHINNVLQLSKTGPGLAEPGDTLTYLLSASNTGDSNATNVVITETVPELSTFTGNGWTCAPDNSAGSTCTRTIANLPANDSLADIPFVVTLPAAVPLNSDTITNVAVMGNAIDTTEPVIVVTTLNVTRGLALSKTDGGIAAAPGEVVTYTLRYTNTGNIALANVRVTETVPLHSTFFGSGAVWSCPVGAAAGTVCSTAIGTLAGGASGSVQFSVLVANPLPTGAAVLDNGAEIGAADLVATVSATDTTPLNAVVTLQLSKAADVATTAPSGFIVYTLRYTNTGNIGAANVPLSEIVPDNTTFVPASSTAGWLCTPDNNAGSTCALTVTSIPGGGQSGSAIFAVQVAPTVATGTPAITNTANLSGTPATVSTPLVILTGIALDKDDGGITSAPGQLITYTLRYTNTGNNLLTGVKLTETVPANTVFVGPSGVGNWSCAVGAPAGSTCVYTVGALPPLAAGQVSFRVQVNPTLAAGVNQILNSALIADGSGAGGNDSEATPVVTTVQLHLSKTANVASAAPNGIIIYTLSYSNTGNAEALNIPLTETVPANAVFVSANSSAGWSCANGAAAGTPCNLVIPSLAGGAQGSVAFAIKVNPVLPVGVASITNIASLGSLPAVQVVTPLNTTVTLALEKSDLNASATPGDTIVYTLTYANNGNIGTANAVLTETVPANTTFSSAGSSAGWSCANGAAAGSVCVLNLGTLAGGGAGGAVQFAVKVDGNVTAVVAQIDNTAKLGSATGAPINASDSTPVTGIVTGAPDIAVNKTDNRTQVAPGQTIVYVLTTSNSGTADATGVTLSDPLPASLQFVAASNGGTLGGNNTVVWTIGTLAKGSSVQRSVTVTVKSTVANNTQIVNAATAQEDGTHGQEPDVDNNTSVDTDLVLAVPVLTLRLSASPDGNTPAGRVRTGDHITYTLTVSNTSVAQATNVTLRNVIPAGTQFVAGSASPTQTSGPNPLVWNLGLLSGGQTRTVQFSVVVTAIDNITAISNAATVLSSQTSPVNSNTVANPFQTTDVTPGKTFLYLPVLAK